jgi:hypothetical protein
MAEVQAPAMVTGPGGRRRQSEEYWRGQVEAWRGTGLTQSEYCRRGGVNWYGFRYWKAKVDCELAGVEGAESKFVAVKAPKVRASGGEIRIEVGGRYVVEVTAGFDRGAVEEVLALLERR